MEDLQGILEKINRDGVEKAEAAAKKITAEAEAKAAAMVESARKESAKLREEGEKAAKDYEARALESLRQAARDTVLKVEAAVMSLLEKTLAKDVDDALSDGSKARELVAEAVRGLAGEAEVAVPAGLAEAVRAQLAAQGNITVVTDDSFGTGFSVRIDGGRVESAFTGEVVAAELARRLRPDLAALLK